MCWVMCSLNCWRPWKSFSMDIFAMRTLQSHGGLKGEGVSNFTFNDTSDDVFDVFGVNIWVSG